jgi:hypothetical protein
MSELKVNTIEANNTLTANTLFVGNVVTINSSGIFGPSYTVNTSAIVVGNSSSNVSFTANMSVSSYITANDVHDWFGDTLTTDVYAWVTSNGTTPYHCVISQDTSVGKAPGSLSFPLLIVPTGVDPIPGSTYNSNTWNLAPTTDGDVWKVSGYVLSDKDLTITPGAFILLLLANTSGNYGTAGTTSSQPDVVLNKNQWTYFEKFITINGNANTAYVQLRLDGVNSGDANLWYGSVSLKKTFSKSSITETVNTQIFTANGTWTKPSWATDGKELVIVHMWGGGGGGSTNATSGYAGAGGAFVYGYFIASNCNATCNVVVGVGGSATVNGTPGGISLFYANTTNSLTAYGGEGGNQTVSGGGNGGGWFANTGPLVGTRGTTGTDSTFGGGGGAAGSPYNSGNSVYGGGGGGAKGQGRAGSSIYGGGGGGGSTGGDSVYGGAGGKLAAGSITGGGGDASQIGASGEVRVYTIRILS